VLNTGAALLWRVKGDLRLPVAELLPDRSCRSVLISPKITGKARQKLIEAGPGRRGPRPGGARYVRVAEYEVPDSESDGKGELIALITTIADPRLAHSFPGQDGISEFDGGAGIVAGAVLARFLDRIVVVAGALDHAGGSCARGAR
jgi:hypothetical protein